MIFFLFLGAVAAQPSANRLELLTAPDDSLVLGAGVELWSTEPAPVAGIRRLLGRGLRDTVGGVVVRLGTTRGTNALLERRGVLVVAGLPFAVRVASVVFVPLRSVVVVGAAGAGQRWPRREVRLRPGSGSRPAGAHGVRPVPSVLPRARRPPPAAR